MLNNYDLDVQKLFLKIMLQDAECFVRVQNIFNVENFDRELKPTVEFIKHHYDNYKSLPTLEQLSAVTKLDLSIIGDLVQGQYDWFLDEFEAFTRKQEIIRAISKAADLIYEDNYGPVEKLVKDALQISLTKDLGTDYFADPKGRLMRLKDGNGQMSTGWPTLDNLLYGGFSRGELNIFAGGSGSGKSLFMMNLALNWIEAGLHGVYLSLELYEDMSAKRIDSMLTGINAKDIFREIDNVEMIVKMKQKSTHGGLHIKYIPAQSNVNDIRAYLKELQVQTGRKIDFLCVDYLDLLMPASAKVSPNDLFIKDKYVSEELRDLAKDSQVLFVTASQLNRSAVDEVAFDHSHISGGISKINSADNVFAIRTGRALQERGRYELHLLKTRSSSGVGKHIELGYDVNTMRITDVGDSDTTRPVSSFRKNAVLDGIKTRSEVSDSTTDFENDVAKKLQASNNYVPKHTDSPFKDEAKITAEVNSSKLKALLGQIKQG